MTVAETPVNPRSRVLFASLVGTTIEFYDFYIYATAAVLVFPQLFFPSDDPMSGLLGSLATFAIAFFARPFGAALFGHFGDRIGRKATLVAALLTMGVSTVVIGFLPTFAQVGLLAPLLLALCRFGQGLGLGGEWGGAVLLATENAPPGKRAWYGMFPQLGAPLGFILSGGSFLLLQHFLSDEQFFSWGWRVPFLASAVLVIFGLYIRLQLEETPVFKATLDSQQQVRMPMLEVCRRHPGTLVLGTMAAVATFLLFYLTTVFSLTWGTTELEYSREQFLVIQLIAIVFFALATPLSALLAERFGRRLTMIGVSIAIVLYGFAFEPLFGSGDTLRVMLFLVIGLFLMGLTYGPLGTLLSELFPTEVRYTGASLTFNIAGILGASLAPAVATTLASKHGLGSVGIYLGVVSMVTVVALLLLRETRDEDLRHTPG
ncbi:MFS transporter [Isoalcanivorax beigongshangi]|uniref:MFS transporter n=1 Tax=Isoalcanivorax beigongshangi TaxID=3238810 RepID=A0ABV4AE05_9GAMM